MSLSNAFSNCGLIFGIISLILSPLILAFGLHFITVVASSSLRQKDRSLHPERFSLFSLCQMEGFSIIGYLAEVSLICTSFLASLPALIVAGRMTYRVLRFLSPEQAINQLRVESYTKMFVSIILSPFCFSKDITNASLISFISFACIVYIALIALVYCQHPVISDNMLEPVSLAASLRSFFTFLFAYSCAGGFISVLNETSIFSVYRIDMIIYCASVTAMIIFGISSICPFLTFGRKVSSNFLEDIGGEGTDEDVPLPVVLAWISAIVSVSASFVLNLHPLRNATISLLPPAMKDKATTRYTVTAICILLVLISSLWLPDLSLIFSMGGLIGANTSCLFVPAYMYCKQYLNEMNREYVARIPLVPRFQKTDILAWIALLILITSCALYPLGIYALIAD